MKLVQPGIVGLVALSLAACSAGEEGGRSTAKISEIDWTLQSSGQTTIGIIDVGYQGREVVDVVFRENGAAAGRMEFSYSDGRVDGIDVVDAEGDRGSYSWSYDGDRLTSILWSVPQVVSHEQELEYDDAAGGRPERMTATTSWSGTTPISAVTTYDYDAEGRLVEIAEVEGTSTWSSEIRYDQDSRIERVTQYQGSEVALASLEYDGDGRLSLVESDDGDRYEVSYDDEGRIDEILLLSPGSGTTLTVRYSYVPGDVTGLTFDPNLPVAGLVDLRGTSFAQPDFTAVAAPLRLFDVPAPIQAPSCGHDVCTAGAPLESSCDTCVANVCAQDSYCCTSGWDATCVQLAENVCGASCGSSACSHDVCTQGAALSSSCDSCTSAVCAQDSYCCTTGWDDTCIQLVGSVCGIGC